MSDVLNVFMDGVLCGQLHQGASGEVRFVYDPEYLAHADPTPLSLSMPMVITEHRKKVVLPFIEGLITDNPQARKAMAEQFGVSPRNAFALLRHMGSDVAGALQFLPPDVESPDADPHRGGLTALSSAEVHERLRAVVEEYRDGRAPGLQAGRFSLAGAQPKIALCKTEAGEWALPGGSTPTTHILKPVSGEYRRLDIVEYMTMRAAKFLGLEVAGSELADVEGVRVFVSTRYDRAFERGRPVRLHQEDLGQSLAVLPEKKYQRDDGGPGVAEVARLLRGLPEAADRRSVAWAFFRGLMFNTLLECTDAHIKNYSVMLKQSAVTLAPLYDLATFAPYKEEGRSARSAMKIGNQYRFDAIGTGDCLKSAKLLQVDENRALGLIEEITKGAVGAFEQARDELLEIDTETAEYAQFVLDSVAALPRFSGRG